MPKTGALSSGYSAGIEVTASRLDRAGRSFLPTSRGQTLARCLLPRERPLPAPVAAKVRPVAMPKGARAAERRERIRVRGVLPGRYVLEAASGKKIPQITGFGQTSVKITDGNVSDAVIHLKKTVALRVTMRQEI